jgi:hypothetical protein
LKALLHLFANEKQYLYVSNRNLSLMQMVLENDENFDIASEFAISQRERPQNLEILRDTHYKAAFIDRVSYKVNLQNYQNVVVCGRLLNSDFYKLNQFPYTVAFSRQLNGDYIFK